MFSQLNGFIQSYICYQPRTMFMRIPEYLNFIVRIKKRFFPTAYDLLQKKIFAERKIFYGQFIAKNDLCFDIGANYGNRTAVFLELGAKVIALEPQEKCFRVLQKKYGKKALILQKGAGAKQDVLDFYINEKNSPVSTFSKDWIDELKKTRFADNEWNQVTKVEIVTLDSLIEGKESPCFIKIDVEGFELEVLKGLSKPFKYLSFEYAVPEKLDNLKSSLQHLASKYQGLVANYAIGEEASLQRKEWMPINEMMDFVSSEEFIASFAGDIYIRSGDGSV
jgi:FkbM family methyltransferase